MLLVVAILTGASPAQAQVSDLDRATRQNLSLYLDCVERAVRRLDDFTSDASTISRAASSECSSEAEDTVLVAAGNDATLATQIRNVVLTTGMEVGTTTVLKNRATSRQARPAPKPKAKSKADNP
jgi:hypothetical protein